ncbi:condensation domain-containing protein [Crossiella sp. SN42]|nr:condensation domain-containing protein [Crossiella sp. SN42]
MHPMLFHLTGPLDRAALATALRQVFARHEALRTRLHSADGRHITAELTDAPADPLTCLPTGDLASTVAELTARPFDLSADLPLRAWLLREGPERHQLLLLAHHTAFDGWSEAVLCRDLSTAYATGSLPPAPGYRAVARTQAGLVDTADDDYWLDQLRGVPELPLEPDPPGGHGLREVPVDRTGLDRVRAAAALAAWVLALREETGAADFAVGLPLAGRTVAEADSVIGCFASSAVLRFPASVRTPSACLDWAGTQLARALEAQSLPLERAYWELAPPATGRNPFCQAGFVVQNTEQGELVLPGLTVRRERVPQRDSVFELALVLWPDSGYVWHRADVVSPGRAQRLAARWRHWMREFPPDV